MNLLDEHRSLMRKKDAVLLNFFAGLLTMIGLLIVFIILTPQDNDDVHKFNEL